VVLVEEFIRDGCEVVFVHQSLYYMSRRNFRGGIHVRVR
jgi:hypothetical protein